MNMWNITVLAILKQGINSDFDRLRSLANHYVPLRQMLGHGQPGFDLDQYSRQRLVDNIALLSPEALEKINQLLVEIGHDYCGLKANDELHTRCDSFAVETDVKYPTDLNLLRDTLRVLIRDTQRLCVRFEVDGWLQHKHLMKKLQRLFLRVCRWQLYKNRPEEVSAYLAFGARIVEKCGLSLQQIKDTTLAQRLLHTGRMGRKGRRLWEKRKKIQTHMKLAQKFVDQIERRILNGEKIAHEEKIFSIFEQHTRWCSKGKAGRPVELGVPVAIVEDQNQFLLDYQILWTESDVDVAVPLLQDVQRQYPNLFSCSFDRGFSQSLESAASGCCSGIECIAQERSAE